MSSTPTTFSRAPVHSKSDLFGGLPYIVRWTPFTLLVRGATVGKMGDEKEKEKAAPVQLPFGLDPKKLAKVWHGTLRSRARRRHGRRLDMRAAGSAKPDSRGGVLCRLRVRSQGSKASITGDKIKGFQIGSQVTRQGRDAPAPVVLQRLV